MIRPLIGDKYVATTINTINQGTIFGLERSLLLGCLLVIGIVLIAFLVIVLHFLRKSGKRNQFIIQENENLKHYIDELTELLEKVKQAKSKLEEQHDALKKSQEHIRKLAYTDYLTQLPNRIAFTEALDNILYTLRQEEKIAIMDIDLDNFKVINDTLGHSYGDELLIDVTHRLKQAITEDDYLARIGGDEFYILSQNIKDISQYEDKIKKIMKVFSYPFVLSTKEFFITVSIGIVLAPNDGKSTQMLLKNVDTAMYAAKGSGKDTYCYFDESMNISLTKKIELQSEIRKAIERKEFVTYYQPQIQLENNQLVGFEALLRWKKSDGTIVPPMEFIPMAEETGLIVPIGQYVLLEACKELKLWNDKGYKNLTMSVNLSVRQFKDRDFVQMVNDIIQEVGTNPRNLEFEITESLALEDMEYTVNTIKKLQEIGVKFSLDDFGTGYSSLHYLKDLPINILKIDKSFLDAILENESEQKIVQTIITLAQVLDLKVVAEGVECVEQEDYLKNVRCDRAQGYLYSKPVPSYEAYELIRKYCQLRK